MTEDGKMKTALGEQDYVLPEIYFPSIVTIKDPTEAEFIYVLNNILRTKRYGAQNTRTGTVENHIVGIAFSDGEIFSNLQLTQALYDALPPDQRGKTPLSRSALLEAMGTVVPTLLQEDGIVFRLFTDERLKALIQEVTQITSDETRLVTLLKQATVEANTYAKAYGVDMVKEAKSKK